MGQFVVSFVALLPSIPSTFDSYWLNAIPLFIAGYIVHAAFDFNPSVLRKLGKWDDITGYVRKLPR